MGKQAQGNCREGASYVEDFEKSGAYCECVEKLSGVFGTNPEINCKWYRRNWQTSLKSYWISLTVCDSWKFWGFWEEYVCSVEDQVLEIPTGLIFYWRGNS